MFKGQVLVSTAALMIQHNFHSSQPKPFFRYIEQLLKIMANVNREDTMYRRTACQCLHELELSHPGLLARKLGHISELCAKETTHVAEAYTVLFSAALRHAVLLLVDPPAGSSTERVPLEGELRNPTSLHDLLKTDGEHLMPYHESAVTTDTAIPLFAARRSGKTPTVVGHFVDFVACSFGRAPFVACAGFLVGSLGGARQCTCISDVRCKSSNACIFCVLAYALGKPSIF
jgi:hypothetical protein